MCKKVSLSARPYFIFFYLCHVRILSFCEERWGDGAAMGY